MPVRYEIEVEFHDHREHTSETLNWRWMPVATLDDAEATIAFPAEASDMWSRAAWDAYQQRIDDALARYGRPAPDRQYTCGQGGIPDFANKLSLNDGQVDETAVLRAVASRIEKDLEHLFSQLPASDKEAVRPL